MATRESIVVKSILFDRVSAEMNQPTMDIEGMEAFFLEELRTNSQDSFDLITDLSHLVSFTKIKRFSPPFLALTLFIDEKTTPVSRNALITALRMIPAGDHKTYALVCHLAQRNSLEPFTRISTVAPLQIYQEEKQTYEQYNEWYLLFELFDLSKMISIDAIPSLARMLDQLSPSMDMLTALKKFLHTLERLDLLHSEVMNNISPYIKGKPFLERLQQFFLNLKSKDLLLSDILEQTIPLLAHLDTLDTFVSIYHEELRAPDSHNELLTYLPHFCSLIQPVKDCYDDFIPTNTPLHLAVLEQDRRKLHVALSTFATPQLLTYASWKNTALLLACKIADKTAALCILAKMRELSCDVNQADGHGMTALHWAQFYHFDDLAKELIDVGANKELKTVSGKNCSYFYNHQFTLSDFRIIGADLVDEQFKLVNSALTDLCFHMDKIALNLRLATQRDIQHLYESSENAQYRSSNRFQLFFKTYRSHLVTWLERLEQPNERDTPVFQI